MTRETARGSLGPPQPEVALSLRHARTVFAALALASAPGVVQAADVDTFDPSGSGPGSDGGLETEAAHVHTRGLAAGASAWLTQDPLVIEYADGREEAGLESALGVTAWGAWSLRDRARFDLFVPFYPWVKAPWTGFAGPAMGDLAVQAHVVAFEASDAFALSANVRIGLPTATRAALVSRGFDARISGVVGGDLDFGLGWSVQTGFTIAPNALVSTANMGSTWDLLGTSWYRVDDRFRVGLETRLAVGLLPGQGERNTWAVGHLYAQTLLRSGLSMTVGAGAGLIDGVGAPQYRVVASIAWVDRERDRDGDGIPDDIDHCPDDPEDFDDFEDEDGCPDVDDDGDGILDGVDRCRLLAEDFDGYEDEDGCPDPDNDYDGILDVDDACPDEFGHVSANGCPDRDGDAIVDAEDACPDEPGPPETQGCPDRDGDGIPDHRDRCPDEASPADENPLTADGCPKRVYVNSHAIIIKERVHFEYDSSRLRSDSVPILEEIRNILVAHPGLLRVEIQGHTDSKGTAAYNLRLSQSRADAVRDWLIARGIAPDRLTAKGYGFQKPVDTNFTDVGRAANRRVECSIVEQATDMAWSMTPPELRGQTPSEPPPPSDDGPWGPSEALPPAPPPVEDPWDAPAPEPVRTDDVPWGPSEAPARDVAPEPTPRTEPTPTTPWTAPEPVEEAPSPWDDRHDEAPLPWDDQEDGVREPVPAPAEEAEPAPWGTLQEEPAPIPWDEGEPATNPWDAAPKTPDEDAPPEEWKDDPWGPIDEDDFDW